ncbi:right-handed parallel beta-helix repeat-containing protein [Nocardioides pantholopis]|uniref:right-handed parallel beta-helix repeat-containing protein n=1 Tax=Nocardioides pantholopis TaxID=2483798 RepID=UPI0019CFAF60|nr:right-handed parallel beta-helix repeat-containing protein [Nocardioides pantholopis]
MRLPESPRARLLAAGAGGVILGMVLALGIVAAWPDDDPGARAGDGVATPTVPPAPTIPEIPESTLLPESQPPSPTQTESEEESDEPDEGDQGDEGDQPDSAPLLPDAAPAGEGPLPDTAPVRCPAATTTVTSTSDLEQALAAAAPGDSIELADGTYAGSFATTASGTEEAPIFLCGTSAAVLDGGDVEGDYALHLDGARYWRLVGFTVSGGQKGVVADGTAWSVIQGLTVSGTGDEAIHLRSHSTDSVVRDNAIGETGLRRDKYGEGVYLGSAVSNWCTYTDCEADRSDRNVVIANTFSGTAAEAIDVKEGTTGGAVLDNTFDGSALTGADSWVDLKGNNYLVQGNTGTTAPEDGFQTHQILDGWGDFNVFAANHADVQGPGAGISSWPPGSNVVRCDNTVAGAGEGLSNISCS